MNVERAFSILIGVAVMIILTPEINNVIAQPDVSLESQRYIEESFFNQIVGEVINNGSEVAEFVGATTSFYDSLGDIVGTSSGFADPETIQPGMKSPFTILITSDTVANEAATYSFTLQWQDSGGNDYSKLVLENELIRSSIEGQESSGEEDSG
jgi:hypothetical protein